MVVSVYKEESGLIFDDRFNYLDSRWITSPTNSCELRSGYLCMQHSESDTTLLFNLPDEVSLLLEVTADYLPSLEGDEGGILVWKSAIDKLEFLESLDTKDYEYTTWRAEKKGGLWLFYAEHAGQWELFDSATLDACLAGVVLKNKPATGFQSLDIHRVVLCRGRTVVVANIESGYKVDLKDASTEEVIESQIVSSGYAGTNLLLPRVPFYGIIEIYDEENSFVGSVGPVDFYGGDVYLNGSDLVVVRNGVDLNNTDFNYLGIMRNNLIKEKMQIQNRESFTVFDVSLTVAGYRNEFGWQWVDVALDVGGEAGEFLDTIYIDKLEPGEGRDFWIKVDKQSDLWSIKPIRFKVDIKSR